MKISPENPFTQKSLHTRRFHYLERDHIQPRLTDLGFATFSVRSGYRAVLFPKNSPSPDKKNNVPSLAKDIEIAQLQYQVETLLEALAILSEDYDKLYSQQFVIGRSGFSSLYKKRSELQKTVAGLKKEAESLRRKIQRREGSLGKLETKLGKLSEPEELRAEIARLKKQITRLRNESARIERTNRGLGIHSPKPTGEETDEE